MVGKCAPLLHLPIRGGKLVGGGRFLVSVKKFMPRMFAALANPVDVGLGHTQVTLTPVSRNSYDCYRFRKRSYERFRREIYRHMACHH